MPNLALPSANNEAHATNKEGSTNWAGGMTHHVVIEPLHDGAVILEVKAVQLIFVVGAVFGGDVLDDIDVFVRVEGCQCFFLRMDVMHLRIYFILS